MTTKKQRRANTAAKTEQFLADVRRSGLEALAKDQDHRAKAKLEAAKAKSRRLAEMHGKASPVKRDKKADKKTVVNMQRKNYTVPQIAEKMKVDEAYIRTLLGMEAVSKIRQDQVNEKAEAQRVRIGKAISFHNKGFSITEIANQLDATESTVRAYLSFEGGPFYVLDEDGVRVDSNS